MSLKKIIESFDKKEIQAFLNKLEDNEYKSSWRKAKLIEQVLQYDDKKVLETFTSTHLKQALEVLEVSTAGVKSERLKRLIDILFDDDNVDEHRHMINELPQSIESLVVSSAMERFVYVASSHSFTDDYKYAHASSKIIGVFAEEYLAYECIFNELFNSIISNIRSDSSKQLMFFTLLESVGDLSYKNAYEELLSWANENTSLFSFEYESSYWVMSVQKKSVFQSMNQNYNLQHTNLTKTMVSILKTRIKNADIRGADLSEIDLCTVDISNMIYDSHTKWPSGFEYRNSGARFIGPNTNLSNLDISGFDFGEVDLNGADLSNANLTDANLSQVTSLANADLSNANLSGARLPEPDVLRTAKLQYVNLSYHRLFDEYVRKVNLSSANLTGADLSHLNLMGVDLSNANLTTVDLTEALCDEHTLWPTGFDLDEHELKFIGPNANLEKICMDGQDLSNSSFLNANLRKASLNGANVQCANFTGAILEWVDCRGTDFTGTHLDGIDLTKVFFNEETQWPDGFDVENSGALYIGPNSKLRGADLSGMSLWRVDFSGGDLRDANLNGIYGLEAKFNDALLANAVISGANLRGCHFECADLTGADLSSSDLSFGSLRGALVMKANLQDVELYRCDIHGLKYSAATSWSKGSEPNPEYDGTTFVDDNGLPSNVCNITQEDDSEEDDFGEVPF